MNLLVQETKIHPQVVLSPANPCYLTTILMAHISVPRTPEGLAHYAISPGLTAIVTFSPATNRWAV